MTASTLLSLNFNNQSIVDNTGQWEVLNDGSDVLGFALVGGSANYSLVVDHYDRKSPAVLGIINSTDYANEYTIDLDMYVPLASGTRNWLLGFKNASATDATIFIYLTNGEQVSGSIYKYNVCFQRQTNSIYGWSTYAQTSDKPVRSGEWTKIRITALKNADTGYYEFEIYVNGVLKASDTTTYSISTTLEDQLTIGGPDGTAYLLCADNTVTPAQEPSGTGCALDNLIITRGEAPLRPSAVSLAGLQQNNANLLSYVHSKLATVATTGSYNDLTDKPTFAAVATSGAYSDLTGTPTIPTVNNGTLTIQQNGTDVQTFTANQSSNATANIQCVDLTSAQTIAGDKDFTGTTGTHDVIPATTDTYDLGSSTKEYNNAYIKALTINGTAAGDILTHNASEFVPIAGTNALAGSIVPDTDNAYELGNSTYAFRTINLGTRISYNSTALYFTSVGNDKAGMVLGYGALLPSKDAQYSLGSSIFSWDNLYIRKIYINGNEIYKTADNSYLLIGGATTQANGANLILNGKDRTTSTGEFKLEARDATKTRQLIGKPDGTLTWGSKNIAMQEDTVPRSGGAVLDGWLLAKSQDGASITLCGGTDNMHGASIAIFSTDYPNYGLGGGIRIGIKSYTHNMYLYADGTWAWSGTACQIPSDQRLKQQITEIDDKLLDAWEDVTLVQFKYNDAVDEKGDNARLHTGYVVQQIDNACKSHNVDISQYGLYCHEEYPEETEEVEVEQKDGTKTKEKKVIREASEHYSLRYTEVYAIECMYLRRCIQRLTARIEELEKGNNIK